MSEQPLTHNAALYPNVQPHTTAYEREQTALRDRLDALFRRVEDAERRIAALELPRKDPGMSQFDDWWAQVTEAAKAKKPSEPHPDWAELKATLAEVGARLKTYSAEKERKRMHHDVLCVALKRLLLGVNSDVPENYVTLARIARDIAECAYPAPAKP